MASLYIFTAGTSLLSNLEKDSLGNAHFHWLSKWFKNRTIDRILDCPAENLDAYNRMVSYYGSKIGVESTAELSSFLRLDFQDNDQVVLLASDTSEGIFSTLVNAHLMANPHTTEPITLWETPGISTMAINWNTGNTSQRRHPAFSKRLQNQVHIMRIVGLDPSNAQGFENQAVGNLVWAVARLVKYARGHVLELDPVIVFTGGFKVSLPVLTQAASWLDGVPMYGLHEFSDQLIEIPVLRSNVSDSLKRSVLGWAWREGRHQQQLFDFYKRADQQNKLNAWSEATDMSFAELDREIKPLFTPRGSKVALSILGEALLAVILVNLPVNI